MAFYHKEKHDTDMTQGSIARLLVYYYRGNWIKKLNLEETR